MPEARSVRQRGSKSVGELLRHEIFHRLQPLIEASEQVPNSQVRMLLQASCLDLVSALEEIIEDEGLDEKPKTVAH